MRTSLLYWNNCIFCHPFVTHQFYKVGFIIIYQCITFIYRSYIRQLWRLIGNCLPNKKLPEPLALGVFYAPIPPGNRCHSGTKCPLARGFSRKLLPIGDKVPSGGGFLPERYLIRGQKYFPRRPYGISSRKPLPFGDKLCQRLSHYRNTFAEK